MLWRAELSMVFCRSPRRIRRMFGLALLSFVMDIFMESWRSLGLCSVGLDGSGFHPDWKPYVLTMMRVSEWDVLSLRVWICALPSCIISVFVRAAPRVSRLKRVVLYLVVLTVTWAFKAVAWKCLVTGSSSL